MIGCFILGIWVWHAVDRAFATSIDQIKVVDSNGRAEESLGFVRQDSDRLFGVVILVIGAMLALAIVDKERQINRQDYPEIFMFVVAFALLLGFLYIFHRFDDVVKEVHWDIAVLAATKADSKIFPDFLHSPYVQLHYAALLKCFYGGLIVSGLATFSLCQLRGDDRR